MNPEKMESILSRRGIDPEALEETIAPGIHERMENIMAEHDKRKKHPVHGHHTRTTVDHHHDGSHTKTKHFEDGHSEASAHGDIDSLHDGIQEDHGAPNPGEAEADAGQHGVPEPQASTAGLPTQGTAAPAAMPGAAA